MLLTTSITHDQFEILTTTLAVEFYVRTVIHDMLNLGLVVIHVDLFTNRTLMRTNLLILQIHVKSITQHQCIIINLLRDEGGGLLMGEKVDEIHWVSPLNSFNIGHPGAHVKSPVPVPELSAGSPSSRSLLGFLSSIG